MFKNILILFFVLTTAYFAYIACTMNNNALQAVHAEFNHIKIYEDGSYTGEDRNGSKIDGCIPQALCND